MVIPEPPNGSIVLAIDKDGERDIWTRDDIGDDDDDQPWQQNGRPLCFSWQAVLELAKREQRELRLVIGTATLHDD